MPEGIISEMLEKLFNLKQNKTDVKTEVIAGITTFMTMANLPFELSAGMGINAFMAYTVVLGYGYTWQTALLTVFIEGIIFIILSVTNVAETGRFGRPRNVHSVYRYAERGDSCRRFDPYLHNRFPERFHKIGNMRSSCNNRNVHHSTQNIPCAVRKLQAGYYSVHALLAELRYKHCISDGFVV